MHLVCIENIIPLCTLPTLTVQVSLRFQTTNDKYIIIEIGSRWLSLTLAYQIATSTDICMYLRYDFQNFQFRNSKTTSFWCYNIFLSELNLIFIECVKYISILKVWVSYRIIIWLSRVHVHKIVHRMKSYLVNHCTIQCSTRPTQLIQ